MKLNITNTWECALIGVLLIALSGCAAGRAYSTGQEDLAAGRYEDAVVHLEEAVKHEPTNARYRTTLRTAREQSVQRLLVEAERQLGAKHLDEAEKTYRRVLVIEPTNARALTGLEAIRRARDHAPRLEEAQRLFQQKDFNAALALSRRILAENPQQAEAAALLTRIDQSQVRDAHAPLSIKTRHIKPVSLQFRDANIRMVFEALSKITGLNFIFDSDVKASLKATIFVNQVKVEDAIDLVLAQSQLAQKVLNDNTLLIYPATPQKLKEYQEQIVKGFYLTNLDPKKAQAMLKTMLDINTVYVDERSSILFVRDAPEAVRMAEKLIAASDLADPEVMLEVEVLEMASATLQQLGIKYPDSVRFTLTGPDGNADSLTWENLKSINGDDIAVSALSVALDIAKQDGGAKVLASPRLRARTKEKAKIHIGDRVPVITSTSTPSTSGLQSTSNVQYLDTGLKLEIEPTVYLDSDVAIKLNLEVSNIVREVTTNSGGPGSTNTVAYQIGTRNAATLLRLRNGETQVLAGLISDAERTTANKIPGLGDLPLLGRLFGTQKDDSAKGEIVLSITPHIVRSLKRPDADTSEFWYGTSAGKRGQPLTIQSVTSAEPLAPSPADSSAPTAVPANGNTPAALAAPVAAGVAEATAVPPAPVAAAPPVPFVLEGPERVVVGEEFEVALNVKTDQALNGLALQLGYEPAVFEVVSVTLGPFALQASAPEKFSQQVNREQGRIDVKIAPGDGEGFTGADNVVVVTFKAIGAKAKSPVSVLAVTVSAPGGRTVTAMTPAPLVLAASQR
jgi:general secretion pathway protein D